jgi:hypothetical protein
MNWTWTTSGLTKFRDRSSSPRWTACVPVTFVSGVGCWLRASSGSRTASLTHPIEGGGPAPTPSEVPDASSQGHFPDNAEPRTANAAQGEGPARDLTLPMAGNPSEALPIHGHRGAVGATSPGAPRSP